MRSHAPGKWTVRQMLIHIADVETAFLDRLRRVLAQDKALVLALDPDRWVARLAGPERNLATAGRLYSATRDTIIDLARDLTETDLARTCVHSERGLLTTRQILELCVWHNARHLDQIEAARDGRVWTP